MSKDVGFGQIRTYSSGTIANLSKPFHATAVTSSNPAKDHFSLIRDGRLEKLAQLSPSQLQRVTIFKFQLSGSAKIWRGIRNSKIQRSLESSKFQDEIFLTLLNLDSSLEESSTLAKVNSKRGQTYESGRD